MLSHSFPSIYYTVKEIKEILNIMLTKSNDRDIALQGVCEILVKDLPDCTRKSKGVDIEAFTAWVAATTAFNLTTHMTILQLHLRLKIIGNRYLYSYILPLKR